jgi:hypothetical protein
MYTIPPPRYVYSQWKELKYCTVQCVSEPERRHGSTRVPGPTFLAHDGILCTFSNRSAPDRVKGCGPSGQAAGTVHHVYKITPSWVTLFQPARRTAVLGQLSSLQPTWSELFGKSVGCEVWSTLKKSRPGFPSI